MKEYLDLAKTLALNAGEIMLKHFQFGIEIEWKADASPVTVADKAVNSMVIAEIQKAFPTHSIYGEEESFIVDGSEYLWVCDPIDGTYPYTLGVPISCFSLALVKDGQPIIAVAYEPYTKRMFTAIKGQGCYLNDKKVSVNSQNSLKDRRPNIVVEASNKLIMSGLDFRTSIMNKYGTRCSRYYCVVFASILVAAGTMDAVVFDCHTAHDIAAVKLLVEEAGGKVTDLKGNEQRYDKNIYGALISNTHLHQ